MVRSAEFKVPDYDGSTHGQLSHVSSNSDHEREIAQLEVLKESGNMDPVPKLNKP